VWKKRNEKGGEEGDVEEEKGGGVNGRGGVGGGLKACGVVRGVRLLGGRVGGRERKEDGMGDGKEGRRERGVGKGRRIISAKRLVARRERVPQGMWSRGQE